MKVFNLNNIAVSTCTRGCWTA